MDVLCRIMTMFLLVTGKAANSNWWRSLTMQTVNTPLDTNCGSQESAAMAVALSRSLPNEKAESKYRMEATPTVSSTASNMTTNISSENVTTFNSASLITTDVDEPMLRKSTVEIKPNEFTSLIELNIGSDTTSVIPELSRPSLTTNPPIRSVQTSPIETIEHPEDDVTTTHSGSLAPTDILPMSTIKFPTARSNLTTKTAIDISTTTRDDITTTMETSASETTVREITDADINYRTTTPEIDTMTTTTKITGSTTYKMTTAISNFTTNRIDTGITARTNFEVATEINSSTNPRNNIETTTDVSYILNATRIESSEITTTLANGKIENESSNKTTTTGKSEMTVTPEINKRPLTNEINESTTEPRKNITSITTFADEYSRDTLEGEFESADLDDEMISNTSGSTTTKMDHYTPIYESRTTPQPTKTAFDPVTSTSEKRTSSLQSTTMMTQYLNMTVAPNTTVDLPNKERVTKNDVSTTFPTTTLNYSTDLIYRIDALDNFSNMLLIAVTIIAVFFFVPLTFALVCLIIQRHRNLSREQIKDETTELE